MNINITYNDTESYLHRNRIYWNLIAKVHYRPIIFVLIVGLIILFLGLKLPYTFYSEIGRPAYYNFNLSISIGGGFIFLALLYIYQLELSKKQFKNTAKQRLMRSGNTNMLVRTFHINSEFIKYSTFDEAYEVRWSAFQHYRIYKGYIALYIQKNTPALLVEIDKITTEQQEELISFLNSRLTKKK